MDTQVPETGLWSRQRVPLSSFWRSWFIASYIGGRPNSPLSNCIPSRVLLPTKAIFTTFLWGWKLFLTVVIKYTKIRITSKYISSKRWYKYRSPVAQLLQNLPASSGVTHWVVHGPWYMRAHIFPLTTVVLTQWKLTKWLSSRKNINFDGSPGYYAPHGGIGG